MSYSSEVLADSPHLYWQLDETSGTNAADASGNGRAGTYSGSPTLAQPPVITQRTSVFFDATDDFCLSNSIVNLSTCTLEVWFDYDGVVPVAGETWFIAGFNQGDGGGTGDKILWIDENNHANFMVFDGGTKIAVGTTPLATGRLHLVGVIDDPGDAAFVYVNGVQDGTVAATSSFAAFSAPNVLVGGDSSAIGALQRKAGRRDEVAVYSTALSPQRILAHYQAGLATDAQVLAMQTHVFGHGVW